MEERKKFGELLKELRQAANVSQDGFLNALNHLLHESIEKATNPLPKLLAHKEREEVATAFSKTDVSKYENGKTKPTRSRVLLFIVYFKQKGVIQQHEANCLLTYLDYAALSERESLLIFAESTNHRQATAISEALPAQAAAVSEQQQPEPSRFRRLIQWKWKWVMGSALFVIVIGVVGLYSALRTPAGRLDWCDDFADGQHDVGRWQRPVKFADGSSVPISGELIYEENGVLNLRATAEQTHQTGVWANQTTTSLHHPLKEVSFQIRLLSDESNQSSGGADVAVLLADGQELSLELDLSEGRRRYLYKLCPSPPCGAAESYTLLKEVQFPVGVAVPLRIVWGQTQAQVYLDDLLQVEPATGAQPMTGVKISLWAHQGSAFHVTVDNLCVQYL